MFRSCDAFRVEAVWLCGITACPPHAEIHKTALGAEDSVEWRYFKTAAEAVSELHAMGCKVMAVEQCEGSTMLNEFVPDAGQRYAVVLGNEVKACARRWLTPATDALRYRNSARSTRSTCR